MTKYTLKAEKRTVIGKKIKTLRKEGLLPANLFGKDIKSQAIQVSAKEFSRVYKLSGETGIIYIQVDGESKERPTLVSGIANNPITGIKVHVDFHQVNLKEKVTANVPVEIIGESELVKSGNAALLTTVDEIEVEALPTDIPENITFDISRLKAIGDNLKVSDAKVPAGVEIKTDPEIVVVSISELQKEEIIPVETETETIVSTETEKVESAEAKPKSESKKE